MAACAMKIPQKETRNAMSEARKALGGATACVAQRAYSFCALLTLSFGPAVDTRDI